MKNYVSFINFSKKEAIQIVVVVERGEERCKGYSFN